MSAVNTVSGSEMATPDVEAAKAFYGPVRMVVSGRRDVHDDHCTGGGPAVGGISKHRGDSRRMRFRSQVEGRRAMRAEEELGARSSSRPLTYGGRHGHAYLTDPNRCMFARSAPDRKVGRDWSAAQAVAGLVTCGAGPGS